MSCVFCFVSLFVCLFVCLLMCYCQTRADSPSHPCRSVVAQNKRMMKMVHKDLAVSMINWDLTHMFTKYHVWHIVDWPSIDEIKPFW